MGLAQPDAAIDEQRVVGAARIAGDLDRGRARELVGLALDKGIEIEVSVQVGRRAPRGEIRVDRGRLRAGTGALPFRRPGLTRELTDLEMDLRDLALTVARTEFEQTVGIVLACPVEHEPVRRQQPEQGTIHARLQGQDPGVELGGRQLGLQLIDTVLPQGHGVSRHASSRFGYGGARDGATRMIAKDWNWMMEPANRAAGRGTFPEPACKSSVLARTYPQPEPIGRAFRLTLDEKLPKFPALL